MRFEREPGRDACMRLHIGERPILLTAYEDGVMIGISRWGLNDEWLEFENNVLRLHMVGCSYHEIAERLNKTPKAIDNALQRIRKKLKEVSF